MSAATLEELYNSASAGDVDALVEYAGRLMVGMDCQQDPQGAVQCLMQAVKLGSGEGALQLGLCYAYGTGVEPSDKYATDCYRKGAELGNPEAMYRLFQSLSIGSGCSENMDEADMWLEKAKDLGNEKAQESWKSLTDSGMLSRTMKQEAAQNESGSRQALLENEIRSIGEKIAPNASYNLEKIVSGNTETEIISENYEAINKAKSSLWLILVYAVIGGLSGYVIHSIYESGKSVLNSQNLWNYLNSVSSITIYLTILGVVLGGVLGFILSLAYRKSTLGLLFYLPVLLMPLLIVFLGPLLMPVVIALGKLLYGLLTIAVGLLGVYCVCASSSG